MKVSMTIGSLLILLFSVNASSASFNCNKASAKIEKLICSDDELGFLDEELLAAYKLKRSALADDKKTLLKKEQRAWLKKRNKRCVNARECRNIYSQRIMGLLSGLSEGNLISAKDFYERFNMRSIYSSYDQRLKYYCESYPKDFFKSPKFVSINQVEFVDGDDIWIISIQPNNKIKVTNKITSGTYSTTSVHRLYFDKHSNEWRSLETFIGIPKKCVPYASENS